MKESYSEIVARYAGPESYADRGNTVGVATTGVHAGPEIEFRYQEYPVCRRRRSSGRQHQGDRLWQDRMGTAESKAWSMRGNFKHENREIPSAPQIKPRWLIMGTLRKPLRGQN